MNSEKPYARVQYLEQKIMQLLERYKDQQEIVQQLQEENLHLKQLVNNRLEIAHDFSNSLEIGTITKKGEELRDVGSSIDSYIRDIDKSIAYFERLE
jgi:regulator of replication initiation timing